MLQGDLVLQVAPDHHQCIDSASTVHCCLAVQGCKVMLLLCKVLARQVLNFAASVLGYDSEAGEDYKELHIEGKHLQWQLYIFSQFVHREVILLLCIPKVTAFFFFFPVVYSLSVHAALQN